jgi:hypothetical protein
MAQRTDRRTVQRHPLAPAPPLEVARLAAHGAANRPQNRDLLTARS